MIKEGKPAEVILKTAEEENGRSHSDGKVRKTWPSKIEDFRVSKI